MNRFAFSWFQHTAARRRLARIDFVTVNFAFVSTHSRPKAAGSPDCIKMQRIFCFNTQPPEGGWMDTVQAIAPGLMFQHTAARRRLDLEKLD